MARRKLFGENGLFGKKGGRNLIIVLSVLIIGAAVYLNYLYFFNGGNNLGYGENNGGDTSQTDTNNGTNDGNQNTNTSTDDTDVIGAYFSSTLLNRQQARDEALEVLQTVVASADALETTKNEALMEISRIALDIEKESNIETLVKAKGFTDCVAVLSDDSVSVIVRQEGDLLQNQIVQIKEIVYEETGILPSGVKIIKK